ncbi:cysteine hydrolase family protein [Streptomyces iconiensis]|uniref:Cysteine hydrolase family protein n=1 Tax=Streptomyces iconiensis TaxID=1384038 RepID=A0ABT6ZRQ5_9ACTN|nr:cysteine hydrolase family protein [Streptomyces iconiensis]MDJ1131738.1 cysteine hydrolase family protein [Streptomyces iconiensis]
MPQQASAPVHALLVVDMQTAFVTGKDAVPDAERVVARTRELLAAARASGALVVYLQNDGEPGTPDEPHTLGWELHMEPEPGEPVLRKTVDDGFEETDLKERLDAHGVEALAVCGVLSEMCVSATTRTALDLGYRVVLPHDAHATYDVPAAENISEVVPAAMASRAAEWALGDEVEIIAYARDARFTSRPDGRHT